MKTVRLLLIFNLLSCICILAVQARNIRESKSIKSLIAPNVISGVVEEFQTTMDSIRSTRKNERKPEAPKSKVTVDERYVSIDNVCAWPNLTVLKDGQLIATIFNQPSHALIEGDIECWESPNGRFWKKKGTPAPHDPNTTRNLVAAGLASNGDLIVIAGGWSLNPVSKVGEPRTRNAVLRPWVSRSSDGGRSWSIQKKVFPLAESNMSEFAPFGDILPGEDGSLRVLAYAQSMNKENQTNKVSMFRSENDGRSWERMSVISDRHNETAFFHLGGGKWIAAVRRWKAGQSLDLFRSNDDGRTWNYESPLTEASQHPSHLLKLNNGQLLLTYGNRISGQFGVAVKISKDEGKTWSEEFLVIDDLTGGDSGYPASIQLPNGKIMTAYYSIGVSSHQRYHMGTVIWDLPSQTQ